MPITCPNGHVNDAGNRFCDQCGAQLPAAPASGGADVQAAAPEISSVHDTTASASGSLACPTCGQENLPGTAFCENCGAQLPLPVPVQASSAAAAPAATPAADGTINCPNCGTDNDPGNAFCEQCGASLAAPTAQATPVADESGVSAGVATADAAALAAPGAQSQPATEEVQPLVDAPTSGETEATIPPLIETPATTEPAAPADVAVPVTPAEPEPAVAAEPAAPVATPAAQPAVETCANCGAELPANAKFCLECGTKVERKPEPAPEPEMVRPTNCQNCSAELPANAKFCLECGAKVELIPAGTAGTGQGAGLPSAVDLAMQQTAAPALPSALDVATQRADQVADQAPSSSSVVRTYDAEGAAAAAAPVVAPPTAPAQPDVVQQAPVQPEVVQQAPAQPVAPVSPPVQQAPVSQGGPRLISTDGTTISLPPQSELVVGREDPVSGIHPDIDMTPHGGEAGGVSRRHAILRQQGGQWSVTDLDSTNYTRVDGNRVAPNTDVPLHDGARIQFGRVQFEFRSQ